MIGVLAIALQMAVAAPQKAPAKSGPAPVKARPIVVVDAGHGGPDRGMTGPIGRGQKIHEKDITLAVAKQLGRALRNRGVDVVYTRTTDTLIDLSDRGRIANNAGGALFISVHVNAASPRWKDPAAARGFETYFLSDARTEDDLRVEEMENASVRFETVPDLAKEDPLSFILSDMKQNEHLRESSELAASIQRSLEGVHPGPSRGVKQAGFRVLVTSFMPSVLVELGFGTNPAEAAFLADPSKQDAMAKSIADATVAYLRAYEKRISGGARP
ncbi:MAG TPA: N-acetylmuramoyl-L-alanine amidase [Gemmatimonadaceae bacterium]|nr:N-acetylmuramoyl-L-alanine amidase [Gemmatimonadaceae bacterium]